MGSGAAGRDGPADRTGQAQLVSKPSMPRHRATFDLHRDDAQSTEGWADADEAMPVYLVWSNAELHEEPGRRRGQHEAGSRKHDLSMSVPRMAVCLCVCRRRLTSIVPKASGAHRDETRRGASWAWAWTVYWHWHWHWQGKGKRGAAAAVPPHPCPPRPPPTTLTKVAT